MKHLKAYASLKEYIPIKQGLMPHMENSSASQVITIHWTVSNSYRQ